MGKIRIYHFNNGTGGGVLSVIRNLIKFSSNPNIENHIIYTINKEVNSDYSPEFIEGVISQQVFNYSPKWNFNYTCKTLASLLPDEKAVVIAHDWLELGMVTHTGIANPVVQILHGDYDYYYNLSIVHSEWINKFITVAEVMANNLSTKLPQRHLDIQYIRFPVPHVQCKIFSNERKLLRILFVGRLTSDKGFNLLPLMQTSLLKLGVNVTWDIVGDVTDYAKSLWQPSDRVTFHGSLPNECVLKLLSDVDCLILPSVAEGMPLCIIEGMKAGLTCIVNDIPGGIQELIIDAETGFKVKNNNVAGYVDIFKTLSIDLSLLEAIGQNARRKATLLFDPEQNTFQYEKFIEDCFNLNQKTRRRIGQVYGSRLDKVWIPNFISKTIRKFDV